MTAQDARDIVKEVTPKLVKDELEGILKKIEEQARKGKLELVITHHKLYHNTIICLRGMGYRVVYRVIMPSHQLYLVPPTNLAISWMPEATYVEVTE